MKFRLIFAFIFFSSLAVAAHAADYGIIMGISSYSDPRMDLALGPTNDARHMRDLWTEQGMQSGNIEMLIGENTTLMDFNNAIDRISQRAGPGDTVRIFWASHGSRNGELITRDGRMRANMLGVLLRKLPVHNIEMIIEACYSCTIRFPPIHGKNVKILGVVAPDEQGQQIPIWHPETRQWETMGLGTYLYLQSFKPEVGDMSNAPRGDTNSDSRVDLTEAQNYMNSPHTGLYDYYKKVYSHKKNYNLKPQTACIKDLGDMEGWWEELKHGHLRVTLEPGQAVLSIYPREIETVQWKAVLDLDCELGPAQPYSVIGSQGQTGMDAARRMLSEGATSPGASAAPPVVPPAAETASAAALSRQYYGNILGAPREDDEKDPKKKKKPKPIWSIFRSEPASTTSEPPQASNQQAQSSSRHKKVDPSSLDIIYMVKSSTIHCEIFRRIDFQSNPPWTQVFEAHGSYSAEPRYYTFYLNVYPNVGAYTFSMVSPTFPLLVTSTTPDGQSQFTVPDMLSYGGGGRFQPDIPRMAGQKSWDIFNLLTDINRTAQKASRDAVGVSEDVRNKDPNYWLTPEGKLTLISMQLENNMAPAFYIVKDYIISVPALRPGVLQSASGTTIRAEWSFN